MTAKIRNKQPTSLTTTRYAKEKVGVYAQNKQLNPLIKHEFLRATSRESPHAEDLILGFAQNVRINQRVVIGRRLPILFTSPVFPFQTPADSFRPSAPPDPPDLFLV